MQTLLAQNYYFYYYLTNVYNLIIVKKLITDNEYLNIYRYYWCFIYLLLTIDNGLRTSSNILLLTIYLQGTYYPQYFNLGKDYAYSKTFLIGTFT